MADRSDPARRAALAVLKAVRGGAYANLAVQPYAAGLAPGDAAFMTELVFGTCRYEGTLDAIIARAAGRPIRSLQPGVVDVLRLGAYQGLRMRVPPHAAVGTSVDLAAGQIGARVTGVVNAILRRVVARDWEAWLDTLTAGLGETARLAVRTAHPEWIVAEFQALLPPDEVEPALEANNVPAVPVLAVRPGLATRDELVEAGGEPTPYSPWGVIRPGDPAEVRAVREGRAGVQDEGSQLVTALVDRAGAPDGPWLDLCAGPGGKAALMAGLARARGEVAVAAELHEHRAQLVAEALRAYGESPVVVADGRSPAWGRRFARVLVDAPCTGLGALRRRPDARWRKTTADVADLTKLQAELLASACESVVRGGVVVYATCSPVAAETAAVVHQVADGRAEIVDAPALLGTVPDCAATTDPRFVQLWPHRHHTDAMFAAVLRVT